MYTCKNNLVPMLYSGRNKNKLKKIKSIKKKTLIDIETYCFYIILRDYTQILKFIF